MAKLTHIALAVAREKYPSLKEWEMHIGTAHNYIERLFYVRFALICLGSSKTMGWSIIFSMFSLSQSPLIKGGIYYCLLSFLAFAALGASAGRLISPSSWSYFFLKILIGTSISMAFEKLGFSASFTGSLAFVVYKNVIDLWPTIGSIEGLGHSIRPRSVELFFNTTKWEQLFTQIEGLQGQINTAVDTINTDLTPPYDQFQTGLNLAKTGLNKVLMEIMGLPISPFQKEDLIKQHAAAHRQIINSYYKIMLKKQWSWDDFQSQALKVALLKIYSSEQEAQYIYDQFSQQDAQTVLQSLPGLQNSEYYFFWRWMPLVGRLHTLPTNLQYLQSQIEVDLGKKLITEEESSVLKDHLNGL